MTATLKAARRRWRIGHRRRAGCGTASGDDIQDQIVELALEQTELSPRELAVRFTDEKRYFVSEATVYRLLKAHDLITSPAYVVIKAADVPHQDHPAERDVADRLHLLQDHRLGLDVSVDRARRLLALHHRLEAVQHDAGRGRHRHPGHGAGRSGCDQAHVRHKPRLLSDNGPSYIAGELADTSRRRG